MLTVTCPIGLFGPEIINFHCPYTLGWLFTDKVHLFIFECLATFITSFFVIRICQLKHDFEKFYNLICIQKFKPKSLVVIGLVGLEMIKHPQVEYNLEVCP